MSTDQTGPQYLAAALLRQAGANADVVMTGYTHLRPAQPVTFGFYFLVSPMRSSATSGDSATRTQPSTRARWGGSLRRTSSHDRERVATLLGFDRLVEHALDAVASRDFLLELASACATLGITWSRLAQDLYVWSTDEFGLVTFADQVAAARASCRRRKPVVMEYLKATGARISARSYRC